MNTLSFLPFVEKPGRYLGREYNVTSRKAEPDSLLCALVFPDLYEIGMSHQGLQILYHILNDEDGVIAERCFCPDLDAEKLMKARSIRLSSLESERPLADFDMVGITLPHELCYTNILTILDRANIPFYSSARNDAHPLIIGGGACALNPEPVADFFDAVLLGDGEEAIVEIVHIIKNEKQNGSNRAEVLDRLAGVKGIYIPQYYRPEYDNRWRITSIQPAPGREDRVRKCVLPNLDKIDHLKNPIVPNAKIVHDRLGIEIARGCTRGCRFCQAGITYRPVRERSVDQIMELAESGIGNSGFEELALLSLSTGDYSCLSGALPRLMDRFADQYVSVAMPSMRVGTLTQELMDEIRRVRKTGFTLAPEAGSERLRKAINKGISEEDLLSSVREAFSLGWTLIKLYFMIGLPTETMEDIDGIVELAKKTASAGDVSGGGRRRITVSLGTFVPKPHTPFQWEAQLSIDQSQERINRLKTTMPRLGFNLKWHDPKQSYLEGVFSRGDRRLSALIIKAWEHGARLDSWSDHFRLECWQSAADHCCIELDFYLRKRDESEILPWQHLDCGVDSAFLLEELAKARQGAYTPDCRYHGCQQCGLCDFDTIQPIVRNELVPPLRQADEERFKQKDSVADDSHFKYLVSYSRIGRICYLGHLEFLQIIFRALRRAGIKTNFSKGFNPSPKVSFGPALPVGTESMCEFFLMSLPEPLKDIETQVLRLSSALPEGLFVTKIEHHDGTLAQDIVSTYKVITTFDLGDTDTDRITQFMQTEECIVSRERKGKTKQINIRPLIKAMSLAPPNQINLEVIGRSGSPGIKPLKALHRILGRSEEELLTSLVRKTAWSELAK